MFKVKGNYPYPILLEDTVDYKTSNIQARYLYQGLKNGHNIKIECEINNEEIKKLIENKTVCYAIQIESPNAMYRNMFEFYDGDEISITLKNDEVIENKEKSEEAKVEENVEPENKEIENNKEEQVVDNKDLVEENKKKTENSEQTEVK